MDPSQEQGPRPLLGDIRMIVGGTIAFGLWFIQKGP